MAGAFVVVSVGFRVVVRLDAVLSIVEEGVSVEHAVSRMKSETTNNRIGKNFFISTIPQPIVFPFIF
jgi:hypothetical protein